MNDSYWILFGCLWIFRKRNIYPLDEHIIKQALQWTYLRCMGADSWTYLVTCYILGERRPPGERLSSRVIKHRLCEMPSPILFIGFLRCVKHLTSPSSLYEPGPSWRPQDWIGALPGPPSLGADRDALWGTGEGWGQPSQSPTRAPFLQMDVGPFIASSWPWVLPF